MTINAKRDHFTVDDLTTVGESFRIRKSLDIIEEINDAIKRWPEFAREANLAPQRISEIGDSHRELLA